MSDELIRELAQVGNLRVNSPTSAMSYKEHKENSAADCTRAKRGRPYCKARWFSQ